MFFLITFYSSLLGTCPSEEATDECEVPNINPAYKLEEVNQKKIFSFYSEDIRYLTNLKKLELFVDNQWNL